MTNCPLRPTLSVSAFLAAALFCAPVVFAGDPPKLKPTTSLTGTSDASTPADAQKEGEKLESKAEVKTELQKKLEEAAQTPVTSEKPKPKTPPVDDGTSNPFDTWNKMGPTINSFFAPPPFEEDVPETNKSQKRTTPPLLQADALDTSKSKKRTAPTPPLSEESKKIAQDFIDADKRIKDAPPEKREEIIRQEIPKLVERIKHQPPEVPKEKYDSLLNEVGDALNRLGGHESTKPAERKRLFEGSHDLANRVVESSSDQSRDDFRDALNIRAQSNYGLGRYQPAIDDATTVSRLNQDDERAYTTRALAYYQMQNYNQAMEDAQRALRLNKNNQTAFKIAKLSRNRLTSTKDLKLDRMASAAADQIDREYDAMEEERSEAERIIPQTARAPVGGRDRVVDSLNTQALSYTRSGKHQAAYDTYTKALARDPKNSEARQRRGRTASIMGRYREAVADASAILDADPNDHNALLMRSRAFSQIGRFQEAKRDADRLVGLSPENAAAYKARGRAKENLGDVPGMIADFRRAAALDPGVREELRATARRYDFNLDGNTDIPSARTVQKETPEKSAKGDKGKRFLTILGFSIAGGLLIAYGALQLVLNNRRERRRRSVIIKDAGEETQQALAAGGELEGGFRIIKVLGNGGMGIVYEAEDKALDRKVAIKKMREEIQEDPRERQRFLQEARLVAKMHHPNIVDIHSIVEDNGELYLVFEHVEGETLDQVMNRKSRLTVKEVQFILRGVCHALEYAHHKAVIHRDLKPSNIMITTEGRVKVMDFGIARQAKDALLKSTKTNHVAGTPQYMAPEQEEGTVRPESDIFSLGACLYELVTGERPFNGPSTTASKINKRYTRASRVRQELPAELDKLIDDCLEPDPEKRIGSVVEFRARLDAIQITASKPA